MAQGQSRNRALVPGAQNALEQFKYQVASSIGVTPPASGYWGELTSRDCGAVGGNMVRSMIQLAEQQLSGGTGTITAGTARTMGTTGTTQTTR
ncbi:MAG: alpha/beta-type small acid-soluble spore protein [Bacillota bacterium]|nr:alpha/beta-type small acid-soluble spore protein [Bacillota bacterium]